MNNVDLFPKDRFEKLDEGVYRLRVRTEADSFATKTFVNKFTGGHSRKFKRDMTITLERCNDEEIIVWDYEQENILFTIYEDEDLNAIMIEEDNIVVGLLVDLVDVTKEFFYFELMIKCETIG